jgi:hypothetical protein
MMRALVEAELASKAELAFLQHKQCQLNNSKVACLRSSPSEEEMEIARERCFDGVRIGDAKDGLAWTGAGLERVGVPAIEPSSLLLSTSSSLSQSDSLELSP